MDIDIRIDMAPDTNLLGVPTDSLDLPTSVPSSPLADETDLVSRNMAQRSVAQLLVHIVS